jgi:hypothetical protein
MNTVLRETHLENASLCNRTDSEIIQSAAETIMQIGGEKNGFNFVFNDWL